MGEGKVVGVGEGSRQKITKEGNKETHTSRNRYKGRNK